MNQNISKQGITTGELYENSNVVKIYKNDIQLTISGINIKIHNSIEGNQFYEY